MAFEDAVILAKALRDTDRVGSAFACYERLRRPRVEQNIAVSARFTAGRPAPDSAGTGERPAAVRVEETLARDLDWHTPLPPDLPEH